MTPPSHVALRPDRRREMRFLAISVSVLVILLHCTAPQAHAENLITVVSDICMPYTGQPGSRQEGYAIDVLREIFRNSGERVEYRFLPWGRGVHAVRSGQADILVRALKSEVPEFILPQSSVGVATLMFYTSVPGWKFKGRSSLAGMRVGLVEGYDYRKWITDQAQAHPGLFFRAHGEDAYKRLFMMLASRRLDVVPGSPYAARQDLKELGITSGVHEAGEDTTVAPEYYHYALSPANPERAAALAARIDSGMAALRASGTLARILKRYGVTDWAPPAR